MGRIEWIIRSTIITSVIMQSVPRCPAQVGLFDPADSILCTTCPGVPYFTDVDGDSDMDALVDGLLFRNNGVGTFGLPVSVTPGQPYDMDGDGLLDLVSDFGWSRMITVSEYAPFVANGYSDAMNYIVDFDLDGDLDRLIFLGDTIALYRNTGNGDFPAADHLIFQQFGPPDEFLTPFDWDGDGDLDIMGLLPGAKLGVSYNIGGAIGYPFEQVSDREVYEQLANWNHYSTAVDINADGFVDYNAGNLVFMSQGSGLYWPFVLTYENADRHHDIANVDCDDDAELIIIDPSVISGDPMWFRVLELIPFVGDDDDFVFEDLVNNPDVMDLDALTDGLQAAVVFSDLNGDGVADLAYSNGDSIRYHFGRAAPPMVQLDLPDTVLPQSAVFQLSGGSPQPGFYTGPGVYDDVLYGALAGTFEVPITYWHEDPITHCVNSASDTLQLYSDVGIPGANIDGWRLFPNPSAGDLYVVAPFSGAATFTVIDALGRPVGMEAREGLSLNVPVRLDLPALGTGSYVLMISTPSRTPMRLPFIHRSGQ